MVIGNKVIEWIDNFFDIIEYIRSKKILLIL